MPLERLRFHREGVDLAVQSVPFSGYLRHRKKLAQCSPSHLRVTCDTHYSCVPVRPVRPVRFRSKQTRPTSTLPPLPAAPRINVISTHPFDRTRRNYVE
jgi:hypothetical protein